MNKLKDLEDGLEHIENMLSKNLELSEHQIDNIKDKLKEFEKKFNKKFKPKTITISSPVHDKVKKYCVENNLKVCEWVEDILLKNIK
jgi:ribosome-associated translation inhibitor RaiA